MRVLITGILGQDGRILSKSLCRNGFKIVGTTRATDCARIQRLKSSLPESIELVTLDIYSFKAWTDLLSSSHFDIIYHLAAQSSVGKSFADPLMNISKPTESAYYLLEAVRLSGNQTKIVLAGSTEVFGSHGKNSITENTLKKPMSPYAAGKLAQESVVAYYRNSYGTWVSNVHLSNHESVYRGSEFVTMKIVNGAYNIAAGKLSRLKLGNLAVIRDWGWAPEFMDALILLSLKDKPEDLIIATGSSISLFDFAIEVFNFFGLSFERHVEHDPLLLRMSDPSEVHYDVSKARNVLGWEAIIKGKDLPKKLAKSFEGLLDANV